MKPYQTLGERQTIEMIERKSRFIGHAAPVAHEEEALAFLKEIRGAHREASHNCYAYIIGQNEGIMRYSDDGEPGGTAGMPILSVLRARHVVDAVVVVTRYFGGVLLGAGGLVRAYSGTAALAVDAARVVTIEPTVRMLVEVAYPLWDSFLHAMKSAPVRVEETEFAATVVATVAIREADVAEMLRLFTRITDGKAETLELSRGYDRWGIEQPEA